MSLAPVAVDVGRESGALRVFSHGGGAQSIAALVLAAQGRLSYDVFLFCNVGQDSENPLTIEYHHEIAVPFAERHGVNLVEVDRVMRGGETRTLLDEITQFPRSIPIPVRLAGGGFGNRTCTKRFKIEVVARWTRQHGATPENPATCAIGFSLDELHRATTVERVKHQRTEYPLLDLRLTRADCRRIIADAGLPQPAKSSCVYCPFQTLEDRRRQRTEQPEAFAAAVDVERTVNVHRRALGLDDAWLSPLMAPLDTLPEWPGLFDENEATCDVGSCFT